MIGGRGNTVSSTAGIPSYVGGGGGGGGGRTRHVNSTSSMSQAQMMSPTFQSPHSLYTPHHVDPFRTNGSASMMADPFPATPYSTVSSLFMSPTVRTALTSPQAARPRRAVTHVTSKFSAYTTVYNMESEAKQCTLIPKIRTQVYQTVARYTGIDMLLRRIVGLPMKAEDCAAVNDSLRQCRHPNLVPLSNIYVTDEFVMGSSDVIMEYRFMAGAKSLQDAFFTENNRATEGLLWSFTCQMVGLLRSFHETLILVRGLHWSKIIYVETTGRFYFTGLGLVDLLEPKVAPGMMPLLMKQDIQALGLILFQLAAKNLNVKPENFNSMQPLPGFSQSFWGLIQTCLESNADAAQLCHALGERMSMEVGHQEGHADYLFSQCSKEMHNGRMMRLMMKLNFVLESLNDLQEYTSEPQRYALRLFNQFVFNQVDDQNRLHVDWGHAYHCLNKLDCGSEESIQLIGNNETVLVISYADLRLILDTLFEQLQQMAQSTNGAHGGGNGELDQAYMAGSPGSLQM